MRGDIDGPGELTEVCENNLDSAYWQYMKTHRTVDGVGWTLTCNGLKSS